MSNRESSGRNLRPDDVGTLWTMRRADQQARCALLARRSDCEIRILVDGNAIQSERCPRGSATFSVAARLKERMCAEGWSPIVPGDRLNVA